MKSVTKKLIIKTLENEFDRLKKCVEHCKESVSTQFNLDHIAKLENKAEQIREAIKEFVETKL